MNKEQLLKKTEEKFKKEFVVLNSGQLLLAKQLEREGVYKPKESIKDLKSFLLSSLEEAYNLGEENIREKVWDMIFDSFPADMENLSTMLPDQAKRLMDKFVKKLQELNTNK